MIIYIKKLYSNKMDNDSIISIDYTLNVNELLELNNNLIVYDYNNLDIGLLDITQDLEVSVLNNTIKIFVKIYNDNIDIDPFDIMIPNNYNMIELKNHIEQYYIGLTDSIINIKHHNRLIDNNYLLYDSMYLKIEINNLLTIDSFDIPNTNNVFNTLYQILFIDDDTTPIEKMNPEELQEINQIIYSNINHYDTILSKSCPICCLDFENVDKIRILNCKHIYHSECIDKWLLDFSNKCPICKQ